MSAEPSCDLFIRSYRRDLEWLRYCLAAIERFCVGFREVVVVVPRASLPWARRAGVPAAGVRLEVCADVDDDYLGQQTTKLIADRYCEAEYVVHVDSDWIFQRPVRPRDLLAGDRARIRRCPVSRLGRHRPWQLPTERFLGWPVAHDYMHQPPFTYPRWLYEAVREHCRRTHGTDVESYVLACPPRGFSEFNALGGYAHARCEERFEWIDVGPEPVADPLCRCYWSWGGLTAEVRSQLNDLLTAA